MNIELFQKILETYGTHEGNWPSSERQNAQLFSQESSEALELLKRYRELDTRLDEYVPRHSPAIRDYILGNLPSSPLDALLNWLIPEMPTDFWRPLVAGALPLIIGIVIGTNTWISVLDPDSTSSSDDWETEEAYLLALDDSQISMETFND
jgi:hypothetical protein